MMKVRTLLASALVVASIAGLFQGLSMAKEEDLDELRDAVDKRGEVLKEMGKALQDQLKGEDPKDEVEEALEEQSELGNARDRLAGTQKEGAGQPQDSPRTDLDAPRLLEAPHGWVGRAVSLQAEVQDIITDRSFTLVTGRTGPGSDLLVVSSVPLPGLRIEEGKWELKRDKILLEGMLQIARPASLEASLGWDFPPDLEAVIDGNIVFVASSIDVAPQQ